MSDCGGSDGDDQGGRSSRSSSGSDGGRVDLSQLQQGLSAETLSALMKFLPTGKFESDDDEEDANTKLDETICVAYTPKDVNVISETFKRLAANNEERDEANKIAAAKRILLPLQNHLEDAEGRQAHEILLEEGVVRISDLLSHELCDLLRAEIGVGIDVEQANNNESTQESGFGNVLNRMNRWDMYLRNEGVTHQALKYLFSDKTKHLPLLFHKLFGEFHLYI